MNILIIIESSDVKDFTSKDETTQENYTQDVTQDDGTQKDGAEENATQEDTTHSVVILNFFFRRLKILRRSKK